MRMKIEITTPDRSDHTVNATIEGQNQGSDLWVKQRSIDLAANKGPQEFEINTRQRVVLASVGIGEQLVYDRDQRASIAPSKQVGNAEGGADKTDPEELKKFQENEDKRAEERKRMTGVSTPGASGGTPIRPVEPGKPNPDLQPSDPGSAAHPNQTGAQKPSAPLATPVNPQAGSQPSTPPASTPVGSKEVKADDKK